MSELIPPSNVLSSYHLLMSDSFWEELEEGVKMVKDTFLTKYQEYLTQESIIKVHVLVCDSEFDINNNSKKISFQIGIKENGIECPFVSWAIRKKVHSLDFIKELMS